VIASYGDRAGGFVFYVKDRPPDNSMAMFIGRAAGSPISQAFVQPFAFTGTLERVKIELN
jgi:hypothetical protein